MKTYWLMPSLLVLIASLAGCASDPATAPIAKGHAECLVCKMNVDLACVDVDVDKNTPSYAYNGKTYYFCSDECRAQFAKNPEKYARK